MSKNEEQGTVISHGGEGAGGKVYDIQTHRESFTVRVKQQHWENLPTTELPPQSRVMLEKIELVGTLMITTATKLKHD